MKKLKEYAGVIVALVTVMTALASLGLWAIHVQITPEIRRLDGRIERIEARLNRIDDRFHSFNGEGATSELDQKTRWLVGY